VGCVTELLTRFSHEFKIKQYIDLVLKHIRCSSARVAMQHISRKSLVNFFFFPDQKSIIKRKNYYKKKHPLIHGSLGQCDRSGSVEYPEKSTYSVIKTRRQSPPAFGRSRGSDPESAGVAPSPSARYKYKKIFLENIGRPLGARMVVNANQPLVCNHRCT